MQHRFRHHSVRDRIVDAEVMKYELRKQRAAGSRPAGTGSTSARPTGAAFYLETRRPFAP